MAASVPLDLALYRRAFDGAGDPPNVGAFTAGLRRELKAGTPQPFDGMDLPRSLEAVMKVAKHQLESGPALRATIAEGGDSGYKAARELADSALSTGVWLQSIRAPSWLFPFLGAPRAFALLAACAREQGEARESLHWIVALLLAPATRLRTPEDRALHQDVVELLLSLQRELGASALQDEFESWRDLYHGYRLLERG